MYNDEIKLFWILNSVYMQNMEILKLAEKWRKKQFRM